MKLLKEVLKEMHIARRKEVIRKTVIMTVVTTTSWIWPCYKTKQRYFIRAINNYTETS